MIRIAIVAGKVQSGGKKNLIMEYYRHIDRSKVQFDFICDSDSEAIPDEEIQSLGGRVFRITPYEKIFKNMHDIYELCKENQYPVIHAYNSTMNVFAMRAAKRAGVPVRISESLSMGNKLEKKNIIKQLLRPFSKSYATHYMACGVDCGIWQFGKKLYNEGKIAIFKTVIDTGFNSFDVEIRNKTRNELGLSDKIVIGHIGRFVPQKNSVRLIEIFAAVVKEEPKAVLLLIGAGKLLEPMQNKAEELGVQKNIMYLGRREDIQQFYNAMDLFLLPSLYEGLPVVGLEAESCGLPMFFSTEVTREANACELGHFVDLKDSNEKWADEILEAIHANMPVRRSHATEVAEKGFDSKSEAIRMQNFYFNAIKECTK